MLPTFTVTVTNNLDTGSGSLRDAINQVNTSGASDALIKFNIVGSGVQTITPVTTLPALTIPTVIDGTTQPGYTAGGMPMIDLNGSKAPGNALTLDGGNSAVKGLTIGNFSGNGISLQVSGNDLIQQCYIGTDATGTVSAGNNNGIDIEKGADHNTIGGGTVSTRNVISANNSYGIYNSSSNNNTIQGNYIGLDATGKVALGNGQDGIVIVSGTGNHIGGTSANQRNVISGNTGDGIDLTYAASSNIVLGNYIGTDKTGTVALVNSGDGIAATIGSTSNTIGGTTAGAGNLISGNRGYGVNIASSNSNQLFGNYIGTNFEGLTSLQNVSGGVLVSSANSNVIGGSALGARNIISGNGGPGVSLGGMGNVVQGNFIGTDYTGTKAVGNSLDGVSIGSGATQNVIGGTVAGQGNTIWYNLQNGVHVDGSGSTGNAIRRNSIYGQTASGSTLGIALTNGANMSLARPTVASASSSGGMTTVTYSYSSGPANTAITFEFFASPTKNTTGGEGKTYLAVTTQSTDSNGNIGPTMFTFSGSVAAGSWVAATATDPSGDTSQFSLSVSSTSPLFPELGNPNRLPPPVQPSTTSGIATGGTPSDGGLVPPQLLDYLGVCAGKDLPSEPHGQALLLPHEPDLVVLVSSLDDTGTEPADSTLERFGEC